MPQLSGLAITGSGSAAPPRLLDNVELSQFVETSDDWIASRTGIRQRHLSTPDESLRLLAAQAGQQALEMAGLAATELDPDPEDTAARYFDAGELYAVWVPFTIPATVSLLAALRRSWRQ